MPTERDVPQIGIMIAVNLAKDRGGPGRRQVQHGQHHQTASGQGRHGGNDQRRAGGQEPAAAVQAARGQNQYPGQRQRRQRDPGLSACVAFAGGKSAVAVQSKKKPKTTEAKEVASPSMVIHMARHPTDAGPEA